MDPISVQTSPGLKQFSTLKAVRQAFAGLRVPTALPGGAELVEAHWMYPPRVRTKVVNGRLEVAGIDYNLVPSLQRGHVILVYRIPAGSFVVDQGVLAFYVSPRWDQIGPATSRALPSGRIAVTRELSGDGFPPGGVRVVGWTDPNKIRFSVYGYKGALSIDEIATIADSV